MYLLLLSVTYVQTTGLQRSIIKLKTTHPEKLYVAKKLTKNNNFNVKIHKKKN